MSSTIQIWLGVEGTSDKLRLPVMPEEIRLTSNVNHIDKEVVRLGEITVFGNRSLYEITIDSFFPKEYNPVYCEYSGFPSPYTCIKKLLEWSKNGKPLRLTITGTNINMLCTIRTVEQTERAGEPGDVYYSLTLKEYRTYKIRKTSTSVNNKQPVTHPSQSYILYTIRSGDTLWEIDQAYDNCTLSEIYALNPGIQATRLQVGQKIKLPAKAVKKYSPKRLTTSRPSTKTTSGSTAVSTKSSPSYNNVVNKTSTKSSLNNGIKAAYNIIKATVPTVKAIDTVAKWASGLSTKPKGKSAPKISINLPSWLNIFK